VRKVFTRTAGDFPSGQESKMGRILLSKISHNAEFHKKYMLRGGFLTRKISPNPAKGPTKNFCREGVSGKRCGGDISSHSCKGT